jgi:hypothetical protein
MAEYLPTRNQVVVTGGSDAVGGTKTELFDPRRVKWSASSATLPVRMVGASMALLGDDCLVAVGGYNPATSTSDSNLDLYIHNSDSFFGAASTESSALQTCCPRPASSSRPRKSSTL